MRWTGEQAPPPLPPPRKRRRFPAEILLIGSSRGLRPSRALPEAEGTDSPPRHPFSDSAEILRISGRGICKEAIFSPGGQAPLRKNQHDPAAQVAGIDWKSRGFTPSRALRGCSDGEIGSRRCRLLLCGSCFRRRGRGALCSPTPPRVTGCERAATLSRSPGAVLAWIWVPDDAGCSFVDAVSDGADVGRSASLRPP